MAALFLFNSRLTMLITIVCLAWSLDRVLQESIDRVNYELRICLSKLSNISGVLNNFNEKQASNSKDYKDN